MVDAYFANEFVEQVMDLEEDWEELDAIEEERLNRRTLRDTMDPFSCPEVSFRRYSRLSRQLARDVCDWLRPNLQRQRNHGLSVEKQVLTAVRFFATGSNQGAVGQDLNLSFSQPSVSRAVNRVAEAIQNALLREFVKFPQSPQERAAAKYKFLNAPQPFEGAIGAIDCTHVAIRRPKEHEEDHINHHGYHSLNVQMVCDPTFKFLQVCARFGGSGHDAFIWNASPFKTSMRQKYDNGERHTWLLGDSGYPLEPWLLTPILDAAPGTPEFNYTAAHCKARSVVERAFGILKGVWECLSKKRVLLYEPAAAGRIINACVVLHNLRIQCNMEPDDDDIEMPNAGEVQDNAVPAGGLDLGDRRNILAQARRIMAAVVQRYA